MLSAKLYEERIVLIESESIEHSKTKYLNEILKPYIGDRMTFLTEFDTDANFIKASRNINNVYWKNP